MNFEKMIPGYKKRTEKRREDFEEKAEKIADDFNRPTMEAVERYAHEENRSRSSEAAAKKRRYEKDKTIEDFNLSGVRKEMKAEYDALTGLANRRAFEDRRQQEQKENGEFSLIMIDIDKFKNVNDRYGHDGGDYVLQKVSEVLKNNMRKEGDYLARWGGEELVVMAPNKNGSSLKFAERLRSLIEETEFNYNGNDIKVTISVGVSPYNENFDEMKDMSDKALYAAKREMDSLEGENIDDIKAGIEKGETDRNQVCYYDSKTGAYKRYRPEE